MFKTSGANLICTKEHNVYKGSIAHVTRRLFLRSSAGKTRPFSAAPMRKEYQSDISHSNVETISNNILRGIWNGSFSIRAH